MLSHNLRDQSTVATSKDERTAHVIIGNSGRTTFGSAIWVGSEDAEEICTALAGLCRKLFTKPKVAGPWT